MGASWSMLISAIFRGVLRLSVLSDDLNKPSEVYIPTLPMAPDGCITMFMSPTWTVFFMQLYIYSPSFCLMICSAF